jgi:HD-like signal output (HDOD) protein
MKKIIYFVGFAGHDLELLQARVTGIWDCQFFADGPAALVALGEGTVDAVVVSAGKGALNAGEFMRQAAARQPRSLRFIVGNVAEQELIINCIGVTHQFIGEPCKPQDLISTIQRGLALDACMSSDQIRALAPKLQRLPSLPSAYFEVLKQVESSSANIQSVGEVIMRDPALTARLLQMVNSAAFALAQKVTDPMDAVSWLGMETVKSLVLCLQVFSQNDAAKQAGISLDALWDHSVEVAKNARKITLFHTKNAAQANEAFTAGLLHDVGRIIIASNLPKEYAETVKAAKEQKRPLYVQESMQFGVHHAQIGAYLMGLWGMPAALVEAAALHHTPSRTPAHDFSVLTAVHVADVFAHEKEEGKSEFVLPKLDPNYLSAIGLEDKPEIWRNVVAGQLVPAEKDSHAPKREKPADAGGAATADPIVPPLPAGFANKGISARSYLFTSVAAVVVSVSIILFWQHNYQPNTILSAEPKLPADTNVTTTATVVTNAPVDAAAPEPKPATATAPTNSVVENPAPAPSAVAAPAPGPAAEVKTGFDSIKLQGILVNAAGSSVILNGQTLSAGQSINGVVVKLIDSNGVTLNYEGLDKFVGVK